MSECGLCGWPTDTAGNCHRHSRGGAMSEWTDERDALRAEVERLRAENQEWQDLCLRLETAGSRLAAAPMVCPEDLERERAAWHEARRFPSAWARPRGEGEKP